jgi:hypothetical protein
VVVVVVDEEEVRERRANCFWRLALSPAAVQKAR